jgi:hypothetical protein
VTTAFRNNNNNNNNNNSTSAIHGGIIPNKLHESFETLNLHPALNSLKQKAVIFKQGLLAEHCLNRDRYCCENQLDTAVKLLMTIMMMMTANSNILV